MAQQPSPSTEPGFPTPPGNPPANPQPNGTKSSDMQSHNGPIFNPQPNSQNQPPPYQHFILYSSFRESVKNSGIIIPRVTEAANLALRYHESVISRPPGFGKTFIINILESLFRREKPLFERRFLYTKNGPNGASQFENKQVSYETNNDRSFTNDVKDILEQWSWDDRSEIHVLRFDFSTVLLLSNDDESVHEAIIRLIIRVAESNHLLEVTQLNEFIALREEKMKKNRSRIVQCDSVLDYFLSRIEKLNEEYVILIDDADYIMRMTEDYSNRVVIALYHTMLRHSRKYQFLFATCVFPTSIPFIDISQNSDVSAVFGFTLKDLSELEILDAFLLKLKETKALSQVTHSYFQTKSDLLNELEYFYGGYFFSPLSELSVLNPVAVIECIESFSFGNFWIERALPWREDSLSSDFLNYFTIFRTTATMLFNEVIAKTLKCPNEVDETVRDHYLFLRYFGLFSFSNNGKENLINFQQGKITSAFFNWKIPNIYLYEYLGDMMISFIQPKVNFTTNLVLESSTELCSAIRDSIQDSTLHFYYEKGYYDFLVGALLSSCGYSVKCHFAGPFLYLTAESAKSVFLLNVYKNSDQKKIAESTFKERFQEGIRISRRCSKRIKLFVVHFKPGVVQVLMCEPNLREILSNPSKKLSAQFESQDLELRDKQLIAAKQPNPSNDILQANQIDKLIFRKKPSLQNQIVSLSSQRNSLNTSLVTFLNRRNVYKNAKSRHVHGENFEHFVNESAETQNQILGQNQQPVEVVEVM